MEERLAEISCDGLKRKASGVVVCTAEYAYMSMGHMLKDEIVLACFRSTREERFEYFISS